MSDGIRGIECVVGGASIVLPASEVDQIVEYQISPLPFALPMVAGLGVLEGELILSLRLHEGGAQVEGDRQGVKAALLSLRDRRSTRWAIEVERVLSFVSLRPGSRPRTHARWMNEGTLSNGSTVAWLDVRRMLADLRVVA